MNKIHIGFDFWGAGNAGDDLMLAGFLHWMSRYQPDWQISCLCAHDIDAMKCRFPTIEWFSADELSRAQALEQADVWIGLGGGVFQTDVGMWILDRMEKDLKAVSERGIPAFLVGVGINNVEALITQQAKAIYKLVEHIWVRDATCKEAMLNAGFSAEKVTLGADVAHIACANRPKLSLQEGIAVTLIAEPRNLDLTVLGGSLIALNKKMQWVCQEVRDLEGSELNLYNIFSAHLKRFMPYKQLNYHAATLEDIFEQLMSWQQVFTSRYHATLAAAWAGSSITVYERNKKLTAIRTELDLPECKNLRKFDDIYYSLIECRPVSHVTLRNALNRAETMLESLFQKIESRMMV